MSLSFFVLRAMFTNRVERDQDHDKIEEIDAVISEKILQLVLPFLNRRASAAAGDAPKKNTRSHYRAGGD
jgi:hypothetical protein